jgi:hypothetical protein
MIRSRTAGDAARTLTVPEIVGNRVDDQFLAEPVTEHDDVLQLGGQCPLITVFPAAPDLRFTHEIEPAALDHRVSTRKRIRGNGP